MWRVVSTPLMPGLHCYPQNKSDDKLSLLPMRQLGSVLRLSLEMSSTSRQRQRQRQRRPAHSSHASIIHQAVQTTR